jgi:hypothetical protein
MDTNGDGSADSLIVFQDNGISPALGNLALPDTVVMIENLAGLGGATLGTTAGANVVQIQDTQAPEPLGGTNLTSNGLSVDFVENAFATTSLALTMLKNGSTVMTITSITGNGTPHLDIVTNQSLAASDWVLSTFSGSNSTNSFSDTSGNTFIDEDGSYRWAQGSSGDNNINLSALTAGYDIDGRNGNDTLIGSSGDDWISGGIGADTMTGGNGSDGFMFAQGESPAVTAMNLGGDGTLNTGDTFVFANGLDRITDFVGSGESVEFYPLYSDLFNFADAPSFMGLGNDKTPPTNGLATDQGYFVVRGSNAGNTFTVNTTAGVDTLIIWDSDSSSAVTQSGILLSSVTPDQLQIFAGSSWILSVL